MSEPAQWVILMTERHAEPGKVKVFAYGQDGKPTPRLDRVKVFASRLEAEAEARVLRHPVSSGSKFGEFVLTAAPLRYPGIPALPWGAGKP